MAEKIYKNESGKLVVPDNPVIPFIEGDGIGPDIWRATVRVIDAAVKAASGGVRKIEWRELDAGEKGFRNTGEYLPERTLELIREHVAAIKGPMTTPVGKGFRSLNVAIRQRLDLYACVRPVRYIDPVPSPMKEPEKVNMVVFRENTEDLYAGIEWESGSVESRRLAALLKDEMGVDLPENAGIGIKPISPGNTRRLVSAAITYALEHDLPSVTLMHKGNIMKFTEGAFSRWGYETAAEEFGDRTVSEADLREKYGGRIPAGKVVIRDRIADMLFQQVLLRPDEYHVIAAPNLNGDYLSDALAAQVGGLGMAPGANIGDECAVFEATHGTAPKYTGLDKVNPGSLILSGAMMLEYLGWGAEADRVRAGVAAAIRSGRVTYDLARQMPGATEVRCSEYADGIIKEILAAG
ncbi:MAG: isocitrate dehydrogenase (NADP(+)) [Desulfobacterales bacterium]|nr:MAG: isocitrate dehydrogenase (NADP(+)) [Desulfobacterales bacterium]